MLLCWFRVLHYQSFRYVSAYALVLHLFTKSFDHDFGGIDVVLTCSVIPVIMMGDLHLASCSPLSGVPSIISINLICAPSCQSPLLQSLRAISLCFNFLCGWLSFLCHSGACASPFGMCILFAIRQSSDIVQVRVKNR